jgi:uncharacterized protein YecE (DUF72 family)
MSSSAGEPRIWIGTSGWSYDGWRGALYPEKLPKQDWLRYYGTQFSSAEINASFYRTPSEQAVRAWRHDTPRDFLFAWKASKFMTHWKRLLPTCANSIALMQTRLRLLGPKLGVVLFQLPRRFGKDTGRLRDFFQMLPLRYRYAFEFRDPAWYADDTFEVLQRFDAALCISDHADAPAPWQATASHVYVRGHGPSGRYQGSYSAATLRRWTEAVLRWRSERREVFVYFDNDQKAAAPRDALRLRGLIDKCRSVALPSLATRNRLHMQGLSLRSNMLEEQYMAKRRKRRYSRSAGSDVKREMHRYKRGSARSGRGGRGGKVKSRKQAIAIGLSKARRKGKKVPKKRA